MSALAIILVPDGILAALICFRWARTLALWAFAALAIWFVICMNRGHAQSSPMVQCRIGSWAQVMPDYACEAVEAGAEKLQANEPAPTSGVKECAAEMAQYLDGRADQMINPCISVWVAMRQDAYGYCRHNPVGTLEWQRRCSHLH